MKEYQENLIKNRAVTAAGGILGFGGVILALLPAEVRDTCMKAVMDSNNPLVTSILVIAGLILTTIGPSLAKAKAKSNVDSPRTTRCFQGAS